MYPFLILSSALESAFYLVLLVALYRDARRHREWWASPNVGCQRVQCQDRFTAW